MDVCSYKKGDKVNKTRLLLNSMKAMSTAILTTIYDCCYSPVYFRVTVQRENVITIIYQVYEETIRQYIPL